MTTADPNQPLSVRAHAAARMMYESDRRGPAPRVEDFTHLDATPTPEPNAAPDPAAPSPPSPVEPDTGWDVAAFDALPTETRAAVMAGTARGLGRSVLEIEAEQEMVRSADVHLHLTDPGKYVDTEGRVDRQAIRTDLADLTRQRPELSRYGHGPGQEPYRPDERRHAAPGAPVGAGGGPMSTLESRVAAATAAMNKAER